MTDLQQFLSDRRKAELQTIHQFWFPGEAMQTKRQVLEDRLARALAGGQVAEGVARLNRVQQSLLRSVLAEPGHAADCRMIHQRLQHEGAAHGEVENAGRMLLERGFLGRSRQLAAGGEQYLVPKGLAERLEDVFQLGVQRVEAADQLSQKRLSFEVQFDARPGFAQRVRGLKDPVLRRVVAIALENQGLASEDTPGVREALLEGTVVEGAVSKGTVSKGTGSAAELGVDTVREQGELDLRTVDPPRAGRGAGRLAPGACSAGSFPAAWRAQLELAGLGTIGAVSLSDFGITVQEPALIIFQEWVRQEAKQTLKRPPTPDTVVEAGIDLYIDLDRVASELKEGLRLTRGEKLPRRAYEQLRRVVHLQRIESFLEGDVVELLLMLAQRIGFLERYAGRLEVQEERLRVWRKQDLTRQVQLLLDRFLEERRGARWSFHQEMLRRIFIETLQEQVKEEWVPLEALTNLVVSTYLLELEEREVRATLRARREQDFSRERLQSTFPRLGQDLVYWLVHRFLPLGVCELGYARGKLVGFRLTALGKEVFGIKRRPRESRLLVNPDLEILLMAEGLRGMRTELALARFAERVSAEQVRRYRLTCESVRAGIRSGLKLAEMERLLEEAAEHPLPESVRVALRDWGKDLDWVELQPTLVLAGLRATRQAELSHLLASLECAHTACEGFIVVHPQEIASGRWENVLEQLRAAGYLVRGGPDARAGISHATPAHPGEPGGGRTVVEGAAENGRGAGATT